MRAAHSGLGLQGQEPGQRLAGVHRGRVHALQDAGERRTGALRMRHLARQGLQQGRFARGRIADFQGVVMVVLHRMAPLDRIRNARQASQRLRRL